MNESYEKTPKYLAIVLAQDMGVLLTKYMDTSLDEAKNLCDATCRTYEKVAGLCIIVESGVKQVWLSYYGVPTQDKSTWYTAYYRNTPSLFKFGSISGNTGRTLVRRFFEEVRHGQNVPQK